MSACLPVCLPALPQNLTAEPYRRNLPQKKLLLPVTMMTRTLSSADAALRWPRNTSISSCDSALRLDGRFSASTLTPSAGVDARTTAGVMAGRGELMATPSVMVVERAALRNDEGKGKQ